MTERTGVGGNNPPSELDAQQPNVDAVLETAEMTLTGVEVETAAQDQSVADLLKRLKAVRKDVTTAHSSDKQPFLDGGRRVDKQKNIMLLNITRAETTAQEARTPYLNKLEAERLETARIARDAAEAAQKVLEDAHKAKSGPDLAEAQQIAQHEQTAKDTRITAAQTAKPTATGLKTVWHTKITDKEAALNHYFDDQRLADALLQMAKSDVHGGKREIAGFDITSTREAR